MHLILLAIKHFFFVTLRVLYLNNKNLHLFFLHFYHFFVVFVIEKAMERTRRHEKVSKSHFFQFKCLLFSKLTQMLWFCNSFSLSVS